ncbi:WD40 repeat domain-containing protein [Microbispora sp. H10830]|uniref:WD40 repeat domain-containing protein n=1 Tax=Microbispora sp. H10830 TaxID=2729109 RepID=UPI001602207C|nr:WD40 repeat domain-containing protein [Microbispora sp. H10830]
MGGAAAVAAALVVVPAPAASADDSLTDIGITQTGDLVAGGGKIFVSGGDQIAVTDAEGTLIGTVTGLSGAAGLAITPDATRLYAALRGSNEVAEIDTGSLTVTRRFDLAEDRCPTHLSLTGDRLWVGYGCAYTTYHVGVASLDLSAAAPEPVRFPVSPMSDAPLVAAAGNTLVVGETSTSSGNLEVYDLSGAAAVKRGEIPDRFSSYMTGALYDLALTPDGSTVIPAFDFPTQYDAWDTTTLTKVRSYGADEPSGDRDSPTVVAISPDGTQVATSGRFYKKVKLYDTATTAKLYTDQSPAQSVMPGTLAFLGDTVYGVVGDSSGCPAPQYTCGFKLWRLDRATLPGSTLTMTAPADAVALEPLTVTGRLTLTDGSALAAKPLTVTRRLPDGTSATLPAATTSADGAFTFTDIPPVAGTISYRVLWDGTEDTRWSADSATVTVAKHPTSITLTGPADGTVGVPLQMHGTLDFGRPPADDDAVVRIYRRIASGKGARTIVLTTVSPGADGSFAFTDTPPEAGTYTYGAEWKGDQATVYAAAKHQLKVTAAG